jgi:hypothetical protein
MKTIASFLIITMAMLTINRASAGEADTTKVQKKIVKTIQIAEDGKTVVDSTTVYDGDKVEVFVNSHDRKKWVDATMNGRFEDCPNNVMYWRHGVPNDLELELEHAEGADSVNVMMFKHKRGNGEPCPMGDMGNGPCHKRIGHLNGMPFPPEHTMMMRHRDNMIDLNDPDIISFEKTVNKDGQEKIVIIRKKRE